MFRMRSQHRTGLRWFASLALVALTVGGVGAASAVAAAPVELGQAATYAVLSGASVGNTVSAVGAPHTTLRGDLGVKPATQPTGFPPGVVTGLKQIGTPAAQAAHADLVAAYNRVATGPDGTALAGDLAGLTLAPGLHSTAAAVSNTGTVTLNGGGDPNAVFVFKIGGALTMAVNAQVVLTNGTRAANVFWQANGAAAVGATAKFAGTLMALNAIAMGAGTQVNGRALSLNGAISLDSNEFYSLPPAVTIAGGASAITTDTTPMISGTTDVESPGTVTVTLGGQTLQASPVDGAWSVTSGLLENGSYPVTASVSDAAGNAGSAVQQLTVDTVLPVVTIDGPETAVTNDATPTITGTSDVAPGTLVHLALPGQVRTALVQTDGTWNVSPAALSDGTRTVTATVEDPAGNDGTDAFELTVDTTAPAATITGGASALTNDATAAVSGTAEPGSMVTVDLADETQYAPVTDSGAWTVTAAALSDGLHRVVMSVSDSAGNRTTRSQMLTVDTVAPTVAITGGQQATTTDVDPTLTGTSNAAPGTTVTVTIAGQTLTTLLQPNGTWNVTPDTVGEGTWDVVASAPDPAGNVGSAQQSLVIGAGPPPAATITGGSTALTNDATPTISGTADVPSGSTVRVDLPHETLSALVTGTGAWAVTAAALSDGPHRIDMSVSNPAGNRATLTQMLTVDTVAPTVTITGGQQATTADVEPTLAGTSNATSGTLVTVTIAGQTLKTLLQPNGTWNVTADTIGEGTWEVVASAPDPAGNVGSAQQTLVIDVDAPPAPVEAPAPAETPAPVETPAPAPAPTTEPTTTPPAAVSPARATTVAPSGAQKLTPSAAAIGIAITAPVSGLVRATATGKVRIKGVKKAIVLTSRTALIPRGETLMLKIKPKGTKKVAAAALRKIRLAIKQGKSVVATITVRLVDGTGVTRVVTRTVKLTR